LRAATTRYAATAWTVYLAVEGDRIADVSFEGRGCAISTAAASLMTEVLKGKTVAEARALFAQFHARVTGGEAGEVARNVAGRYRPSRAADRRQGFPGARQRRDPCRGMLSRRR